MKRYIPTLILILICVAGFWFASANHFFLVEEKDDKPKQLTSIKTDQVQGISIQLDSHQLKLHKKERWEIEGSNSYLPVKASSVDNWLQTFNIMTVKTVVEEHAADLAPFGLDKPKQEYRIDLQDGNSEVLQIGNKAIDGSYYAKLQKNQNVVLISEQDIQSLNKTELDFMEKSPIKVNSEKLKKLHMQWKGQSWTLERSSNFDVALYESEWKLGDKVLKYTEVSDMINKVSLLTTDQLVQPNKKDAIIHTSEPLLKENGLMMTIHEEGSSPVVHKGIIEQDTVWLLPNSQDTNNARFAYAIPLQSVQELYDSNKK